MRFLFIFLFFINSVFAIIDIAPVDFGENEEGFSGSVYGSFQKKRGNTDKTQKEYGGKIQYDNKKHITWIDGSQEQDKVGDTKTDDNAFIHLRHIHQLFDPSFALEAYTQFKEDKFKSLKNRTLYGIGVRYRLYNNVEDYGRMFIGVSAYKENISYTDNNPDENNNRFVTYLSYEKKVNTVFDIAAISYYQPEINNSTDYRVSSFAEMTIHLTKVFDLSYLIEYDYDSGPPIGVKESDTQQKLSLKYKFGAGDPLSAYAHQYLSSTDDLDNGNTKKVLAVGIETNENKIQSPLDTFAGEWKSTDETFSIALDGNGTHVYNKNGLYKEKISWTVISTDTQNGSKVAQKQYTKLVIIKYLDEEDREGRVENYLWSENTLVGLIGKDIKKFKR